MSRVKDSLRLSVARPKSPWAACGDDANAFKKMPASAAALLARSKRIGLDVDDWDLRPVNCEEGKVNGETKWTTEGKVQRTTRMSR